MTRKDFQKLLKDADARKFDIIIVASQERFGTLTTLGSSEGPVATGEPGKAAASDNLLSPVRPVRPEFCCSEFVIAIIEHVCCRHGQQMGALRGRPIG